MIIGKIKSIAKTLIMWLLTLNGMKNSTILDAEKTVEYCLKYRKSLIRYGDGEFFLMNGNDIHYQKSSAELANDLKDIIEKYKGMESSYLLCMPKKYFECSGFKIIKDRVLIRSWVKPRFEFIKKYDAAAKIYGDAFTFAYGNDYIYSKLFNYQETTKIVFVHNNQKYAKLFEEEYHKKVFFIKVPNSDAFDLVGELVKEIKDVFYKSDADQVLISAGPAAKIIVRELSKEGIWAIDTGHCWDAPLV